MHFAQPEVEFAGVFQSEDGYKIHSRVYEAIKTFPTPTNITEVRSFYGMANQLAPFNSKLTEILAPIRPLLSTRTAFHIDEEMAAAFENATKELISSTTLAYYRPGQTMHLYTDASCKNGLGYILKQLQQDNSWRPIQVGSRSLLDAETRYAPIELELTGLTWAVLKCKKFLTATRFNVFTDHRPLVSLCNRKRLDEVENHRLLRCLMRLTDFDFIVEYIPGKRCFR